jgi:hypothetical protein
VVLGKMLHTSLNVVQELTNTKIPANVISVLDVYKRTLAVLTWIKNNISIN